MLLKLLIHIEQDLNKSNEGSKDGILLMQSDPTPIQTNTAIILWFMKMTAGNASAKAKDCCPMLHPRFDIIHIIATNCTVIASYKLTRTSVVCRIILITVRHTAEGSNRI